MRLFILFFICVVLFSGCTTDEHMIRDIIEEYVDNTDVPVEPVPIPEPEPVPIPEPEPVPIPEPIPEPSAIVDEFDLSTVVWLGLNVSSWNVTSDLHASFSGNKIVLDYDKTSVWPNVDRLNANCWVFAKLSDGRWYGATFEWMRNGYRDRGKNTVAADHIKRREFNNWSPTPGETLYFMVSGLCRDHKRNVAERTNVVKLIWM